MLVTKIRIPCWLNVCQVKWVIDYQQFIILCLQIG